MLNTWKLLITPPANNRAAGANNECRGGPGGPGICFYDPGVLFSVVFAVVACHYRYYH